MVGIIDDTFILYPLGSRIKIGDNCGTVKYVGEVNGHPGTWLGIEWDDPKRGKHNGSVNGKHYFSTPHPTGGSFIRPEKVNAFESLEEAARNRYLGYTSSSLDQELIREAQESLQASFFEVVGMEKIARKQSKFEQLNEVSVEGCAVNTAGYLKEFSSLTTLNLSHTLVWRWEIIADIARQVPTLVNLNLSCNRLLLPTDAHITELEPSLRHLKDINLRNCGFTKWNDVIQTARLWPNINSLGLQENSLSELSEVNCKEIFKQLRQLDLSRTNLMDFDQILKLGNIRTLVSLNIMENGIEEIKLPDCEPNDKLNIFTGLEELNIKFNPIWNEALAFNELDKLPKLKRLSKTPHLKSNIGEMFSKAIGIISNLKVLNKITISPEERRGAEYDIWKKYAMEWFQACQTPETLREFNRKHRSYATLIKKYGSPLEFMPNDSKPKKLIKIYVKNVRTGETWEKKVPRLITVQTLQGLIVKQFRLEQCQEVPQLSYVDGKRPDLIVQLDNPSKTLDFFSLQDSDTVLLY